MRFIPLDRLPDFEAAIAAEFSHGTAIRRRDAIGLALGLMGMRVGEVCRARLEELSILQQTLLVPKFKRSHPRTLRLDPSLVAAIQATPSRAATILATRTGRPVQATHLQRLARTLTGRVLGESLKFHSLRHTFAMRVLESTDDLLLVKKLLGHRSLQSTLCYTEARKEVPAACLVKLPTLPPQPGQQLRIFAG